MVPSKYPIREEHVLYNISPTFFIIENTVNVEKVMMSDNFCIKTQIYVAENTRGEVTMNIKGGVEFYKEIMMWKFIETNTVNEVTDAIT